MIQNAEKKQKIIAWRLRIMEDMKYFLKVYKFGQDEADLNFVKELGKDSQRLKTILEGIK